MTLALLHCCRLLLGQNFGFFSGEAPKEERSVGEFVLWIKLFKAALKISFDNISLLPDTVHQVTEPCGGLNLLDESMILQPFGYL